MPNMTPYDLINGKVLASLVRDNFIQMEREDLKPGAEKWTTNSHYRILLVTMIKQRWQRKTNNDVKFFPYTEDFIITCHLAFRKSKPETR